MTPPSGWRSRVSGGEPNALGRPEFAVEFLQRNPDYHVDHANMVRRVAAGAVSEATAQAAFAHRWGLSFRLCITKFRKRFMLATRSHSHHGHTCRRP